MSKFLSIIVPSYKETEAQIYPLLACLSAQTGVDFSEIEVLIVKDGGGNVYAKNFLKGFIPLDIKEYTLKENRGPGMAREAGIYKATGEYLMFCDADDSLQNVGALQALIISAKSQKPDMLKSAWLEETIDRSTGQFLYVNHTGENTWMHGKLIRRQFLLDNKIHFHPDLRVHEDTYFLSVAAAHTDKYISINSLTYLWKFNPNSITRNNSWDYEFSSFPEFFRAAGLAHKAVENVVPQQMEYKTVQVACYCYFCMHEKKWLEEKVAKWHDAVEKSFVESVDSMWHYFMSAKPEFIAKVYNEERAKHGAGLVEKETLGAWLERIGLEVPEHLKA